MTRRFLRICASVLAGAYALAAQPFSASAASPPGEQLSLPVISIESGPIGNEYADAVVSVFDENGSPDMEDAAARIRLRGNSSRMRQKKSYKLHFPDKANPLQTGEGKAKTWALLANSFDASLLRNWSAMNLSARLDNIPYTPHCQPVDVYQNGQYLGAYLLIEAVSVNKHRIAIAEKPDLVEDTGYLIEMTHYAQEPLFWADCFMFEIKSRLSEDENTAQAQKDYIAQYTNGAFRALQSGDRAEAEKYIDIPALVDNCIINEICKNIDVGWDSYYLAKDAGGKLSFYPVWDFDLAFGNTYENSDSFAPEGESLLLHTDAVDDANPWLGLAMRCGWFRELMQERFAEKLPALQEVPDAILAESAAHSDSYERNLQHHRNDAVFQQGDDSGFANWNTEAAQAQLLADWIRNRLAWLEAFYQSEEFAAGNFPDKYGNILPPTNMLAANLLAGRDKTPNIDVSTVSVKEYVGAEENVVSFYPLLFAAGQTYRLSFQYSAGFETELNAAVCTSTETYYETIIAGKEAKTFSLEFTPQQTDTTGDFFVQAKTAGTVELTNLVLEKVLTPAVPGDISGDGTFDFGDVQLLQAWLLGEDAMLPNPKAGDFDGNGVLNAVDLSLMKQLLLTEAQ